MNRRVLLSRATRVSGLTLVIVGAVLLVITQNSLDGLVKWLGLLPLVVGVWLLYRVWFLKAKPGYLFNGLVLLLGGAFTLLLSLGVLPVGYTLRELWPVYMGIIGVSLIPYGAQYRRAVRVSLLIPGLFLILLMTLFLLFSLSVVKEPLAEFVSKWWPLILIFMGLTLVASSWVRQPENKE
jgi:hypothetical protein